MVHTLDIGVTSSRFVGCFGREWRDIIMLSQAVVRTCGAPDDDDMHLAYHDDDDTSIPGMLQTRADLDRGSSRLQ